MSRPELQPRAMSGPLVQLQKGGYADVHDPCYQQPRGSLGSSLQPVDILMLNGCTATGAKFICMACAATLGHGGIWVWAMPQGPT